MSINVHDQGLGVLLGRLEKLERQNRAMKATALALLILAGSALLLGQAQAPRVVQAETFLVTDPSGQMRAKLSLDRGVPGLYLYDANGQMRVGASVGSKGPSLFLVGADLKSYLGLYVAAEESGIEMTDSNDKTRGKLALTQEGVTFLLSDGTGASRSGLSVRPERTDFVLFGASEKPAIWLDSAGEKPRVRLFNREGSVFWGSPE